MSTQPANRSFENEHQFIQWNEQMAQKYDPEAYHLRSNFLIRWIERRRVGAILHFLNARLHDNVLEVGCGAGNVLEQVAARQLHGIDLSPSLIRKSRSRLASRGARLAQTNAERLPFVAGSFDRLICTEVLEHVPDPQKVIGEMIRVAKADGIIVISVPNEAWISRIKGLIRGLGLRRWLLEGSDDAYHSPDQMTDEWHLHHFDLALLRKISRNMLVIRRVKAVPAKFLPLRYVACCQIEPGR